MSSSADRDTARKSSHSSGNYRYVFMFSHQRKRLFLALLVGLVAITFVLGFGGAFVTMFQKDDGTTGDSIGTANGKPVSRAAFARAQMDAYLQLTLSMGIRRENTPAFSKIRDQMAWRRVAALRVAADLGLKTGDAEIHEALRRQFTDPQRGFNDEAYRNFMSRTLESLRVTRYEFMEYLRGSITLAKLEDIIGSAVAISPAEMAQEMARYADALSIEIVTIPENQFAPDVEVSDAEARAYLKENGRRFMVPEKVRVKYVAFSYSNLVDRVAGAMLERAQDYYKGRPEEFSLAGTNGASVLRPFAEVQSDAVMRVTMELATNYYDSHVADYQTTNGTARPFAEVETDIVTRLRIQDARSLAEDQAREFAALLNPTSEGLLIPLERAAAQTNLSVTTSEFFARYEPVPDLRVPASFNRDAFDLVPGDARDHYAGPILGEDAASVIAADRKEPQHVPDYTNVAERVTLLARAEKRQKALRARAEEIRKAIRDSLKAGKSFADAARLAQLTPVAAGPFTWLTPPTNVTLPSAMMEGLSMRQPGELTDPIPTTNGVAIAYVASRTPGDAAMGQSFSSYLAGSLREERVRRLFADWESRLVSSNRFAGAEESDEDESRQKPPAGADDE